MEGAKPHKVVQKYTTFRLSFVTVSGPAYDANLDTNLWLKDRVTHSVRLFPVSETTDKKRACSFYH